MQLSRKLEVYLKYVYRSEKTNFDIFLVNDTKKNVPVVVISIWKMTDFSTVTLVMKVKQKLSDLVDGLHSG